MNDGDYNIAITGNAFDGSSEPGIVWVMQDENGDGLPNDTWYELRGSEYGKAETWQDYAVTYHKPTGIQLPPHGQTIMVKVGLLIIWVLFTGKIIISRLGKGKTIYFARYSPERA